MDDGFGKEIFKLHLALFELQINQYNVYYLIKKLAENLSPIQRATNISICWINQFNPFGATQYHEWNYCKEIGS